MSLKQHSLKINDNTIHFSDSLDRLRVLHFISPEKQFAAMPNFQYTKKLSDLINFLAPSEMVINMSTVQYLDSTWRSAGVFVQSYGDNTKYCILLHKTPDFQLFCSKRFKIDLTD